MVVIDLKDRKILYELDLDCRQSNTQIGKKVGLKKDVVSYRIKRMQEEGVIKNFWTAINTFKLGYNVFRIYINFHYVNTQIKKDIIQYFTDYKNSWAVISVKGPIDIDVVDPASVVPGQSVRFFEVSTVFGTIVNVSGIIRELTPGVEYVATMATPTVLAIIPLKPLKELTTYMAVLTNDINDTVGNDATAAQTYHLSKAEDPWVDAEGHSTSPFFSDATARSLEGLRRITAGNEAAAAAWGIPKEDIVLSWTAQTQAITPVLKHLRSIARPAPTQVAPTGLNTSILGAPGIADIHIGVITLPYYLGVPSASNPVAPLTDFFRAAPGAYVPPFNGLGLSPTSTFVTAANPFPVKTSDQTVPLLLTLPTANSGQAKPLAGWPVVIFGHGL